MTHIVTHLAASSAFPLTNLAKYFETNLRVVVSTVLAVVLMGSALYWAISHHSSNPHHASRGRTGVLVALVAAMLIDGIPALLSWAGAVSKTL